MPKATGKSISSPMTGATINTPHPGGEMGTGLDFASQPHEGISGHNVYDAGEAKGSVSGQTPKSKIETPATIVKPVKVDE